MGLARDRSTVAPVPVSRLVRAVGGTLRGAIWPRTPTAAELAEVTDVGLPPAGTTVTVRALPQHARGVPPLLVEGSFRRAARQEREPLRLALRGFIVEHPRARILVEPAVASDLRPVLASLPAVLRPAVTPPPQTLSTAEALQRDGTRPGSLDLAIATHLHWDHVSGLLDLPELPLITNAVDLDWVKRTHPTPVGGVLPALAGREIQSIELDGPPVLTFPRSRDIFRDGSVIALDLAGHTPGSIGLLLATPKGPLLLAGDAAWHTRQLLRPSHKAAYPGLIVDSDRDATYTTLVRLHKIHERMPIVPTHDDHQALTCCASLLDADEPASDADEPTVR